jgi:hypothetical protein
VQVDDLVLAVVAHDHQERALARAHAILDERADALVHLLAHGRHRGGWLAASSRHAPTPRRRRRFLGAL